MPLYLQGAPPQIFSVHVSSAILGVAVIHKGVGQNGMVKIACGFCLAILHIEDMKTYVSLLFCVSVRKT